MAKQIKFTVGNATQGYKTVDILIRGGKVSYEILRNGLLDVEKKKSPAVEVSEAWLKELDALKIFSWEKNYSADVLNDAQWELTFRESKNIYHGGGLNAYPENFERFLDWIDVLIPEMEFVNRRRLEKVTMNYLDECLTLDRHEKLLTLDKKTSQHTYRLVNEEKVFDACQRFFDGIEVEEADASYPTRASFELVRHDKSVETFETPYNENFLPGLTNFIEELKTIASDLTAEIFSPTPAEVVSAQGKYIFCKVQFKDSYKHYTYQTDDETLAVGDVVDVPVGKNNDVNQARIVEIGYFDEYEAPFPIDRIKKIIGKHIATDFEDY
ncbi:MAG: hypothetical protein SR1Q5_09320 [Quinella sp. 1Q5]|nr:hypothetical protein [Quinella sp. 1Q5]